MLFTRCPECNTTFRVTDEALKKANGQVRCGRCASVFNAYAELHDPNAASFEPARAQPPAAADALPPTRPSEPHPEPPAPTATPPPEVPASGAATAGAGSHGEDLDAAAQSIGARSAADVVAQAERAADAAADEASDAAGPRDAPAISATEVDRVLTAEAAPPVPRSAYERRADESARRPSRSAWWSAAAAVALIALGAQTAHHFRSDLAGHATLGPWLAAAYDALGIALARQWDVQQYQIIDWVATAEPNARGLGSLKITARIQNRGPLRQPYPAVQLRLKDRWETAVGSRMFTPAEYLPRDTPRNRLMSPGETARAQIEVVDPGPDAYGFELDVCVEVEASLVTCGADEVFL